MFLTIYSDIKTFYKDTYEILMRQEAQNVIPLGNVILGNEGKDKTDWRDPANWFMAAVSNNKEILLTAIMTPPHNLTLYATDNINDELALKCLLEGIIKNNINIPGVMAEKSLAEMFAQAYSKTYGVTYKINTNQRIYELLKVNTEIANIGSTRLANQKDLSFLPYWMKGFDNDCFGDTLDTGTDINKYIYRMSGNNLYILEDQDIPVTMTKISRQLQTVCVIGMVYTPPYFRGKGYATACVAAVSQFALDRGFKKCVLYTDLANPTSNNIYMRIGYKPICDSTEIKFSKTNKQIH
ncbi:MAG: GNAT family N-acetyltransferase [Erysipelotrichales bacterium]|nr:GNAT family N-acetyltransferase [Erysipelotrichales bacterium]